LVALACLRPARSETCRRPQVSGLSSRERAVRAVPSGTPRLTRSSATSTSSWLSIPSGERPGLCVAGRAPAKALYNFISSSGSCHPCQTLPGMCRWPADLSSPPRTGCQGHTRLVHRIKASAEGSCIRLSSYPSRPANTPLHSNSPTDSSSPTRQNTRIYRPAIAGCTPTCTSSA